MPATRMVSTSAWVTSSRPAYARHHRDTCDGFRVACSARHPAFVWSLYDKQLTVRKMLESRAMLRTLLTTAVLFCASLAHAGGVYQQAEDFIAESFDGDTPEAKVIWLKGELKTKIESILQHKYKGFRIRYWQRDKRTAWVLDEIGKEKPITTGFVINDGRIELVRILVFRESRGWEVRHDFFTEQFDDSRLTEQDQLSNQIDNVSGATLSVRAVTKLARIALLLHATVNTP